LRWISHSSPSPASSLGMPFIPMQAQRSNCQCPTHHPTSLTLLQRHRGCGCFLSLPLPCRLNLRSIASKSLLHTKVCFFVNESRLGAVEVWIHFPAPHPICKVSKSSSLLFSYTAA
jgi:hypothetical protein